MFHRKFKIEDCEENETAVIVVHGTFLGRSDLLGRRGSSTVTFAAARHSRLSRVTISRDRACSPGWVNIFIPFAPLWIGTLLSIHK